MNFFVPPKPYLGSTENIEHTAGASNWYRFISVDITEARNGASQSLREHDTGVIRFQIEYQTIGRP